MPSFDILLDLLYPPKCVACAGNGAWWCDTCRSSVELLPKNPCRRCLEIGDHPPADCQGTLPFAGVVPTGFYHSPPLRRMIAGLKYEGLTAAASALDAYLVDIKQKRTFPWAGESDVRIQPMPLSDMRKRARGFNQAAWIAERMRRAWELDAEITDVLIRKNGSSAQADLDHDTVLRSANVRGQFRAVRRLNQPVLLVDDVVTTGSTAAEAAHALIAAGAPRVYLATLAMGK